MLHTAAQLHALPRHAHYRVSHVVRIRTSGRCRVTCASHIVPAQSAAAQAAVPTTSPAWASFVSRRINIELALEEAIEGAKTGQVEGWGPELAVVFLSSAYVQEYARLISLLRSKVPSLKHIVGSTGYGVIGSTSEGPEEIEHAPALSLTLGSLPGTSISITHITGQQLPDGDAPPEEWAQLLGVDLVSPHPTNFILLAEPEFSKLTEMTDGLDFAFPSANKIGGLISAGKVSPTRAMFAWSSQQHYKQQLKRQQPAQLQGQLEGQQQEHGSDAVPWPPVLRTGAVVMALQGPVEMELLIAQGCRPLSDNIYTIDGVADGGPVVLALRDERGRKVTPLEALQRELEKVASNRSELMQMLRNMALGLMPDLLRVADGPPPEAHDFLIRGMALSKAGFMIVGDSVRVGQRVRFMVRDREGAQQDLTSHCLAYKRRELAAMLGGSSFFGASSSSSHQPSEQQQQPDQVQPVQQPQQAQQLEPAQQPLQQERHAFGMLLFSCNGRGTSLYNEPSWDSRTLAGYIPVPVSGFMCNGELGSLGGSTHLHGFTCAAAVLRSVTPAAASQQPHPAEAQRSSSSSSDVQHSSSSTSSGGRTTESSSAAEPGSSSEAAGTGRLEPGEDKV